MLRLKGVSMSQAPNDPTAPLFVRATLMDAGGGLVFDVAIDDISAIEVPRLPGQSVRMIVGGFRANMHAESYPAVHAAWVARRRSAAGR